MTNLFMNFNGTAGIWRTDCIHDAGGWQTSTLVEDLDLSFRAQMKGWKCLLLEDTVVYRRTSSPDECRKRRYNLGGQRDRPRYPSS